MPFSSLCSNDKFTNYLGLALAVKSYMLCKIGSFLFQCKYWINKFNNFYKISGFLILFLRILILKVTVMCICIVDKFVRILHMKTFVNACISQELG